MNPTDVCGDAGDPAACTPMLWQEPLGMCLYSSAGFLNLETCFWNTEKNSIVRAVRRVQLVRHQNFESLLTPGDLVPKLAHQNG